MSTAPAKLGPFIIEAEVGRGGMGVVYRAHDPRLDRHVAVKALAADGRPDPGRIARFRGEARLIAQLNHPHVAQLHQLLECDGALYLVFEYVDGCSLAERLRQEGPLDVPVALSIGAQVARGIEAAHARGIVHRDLKPDNIRITEDGTAKVLDFGIALAVSGDDPAVDGPSDRPTRRGTVPGHPVGTPGYMAPEQIRGASADVRADVFALGSVLFECLTGSRVFAGTTVAEVIDATLAGEPRWAVVPREVPPVIVELLHACLAKEAAGRPAAMRVVRTTLEAVLGWDPPTTRPGPRADASGNLPCPVTSFVGREATLDGLADRLTETRLLTLTGMGGSGKTRLAIELARRAAGVFPDGVYLAELAPATGPDGVHRAVAVSLGVRDQPNRTTTEVLADHLTPRALLLVLDNCEHVLEASAALVARLLRAAGGLRVVATSRAMLGVPGEMVWRVPGLSLPSTARLEAVAEAAAVRLFADRARAARPSFRLDERNAEAVARICRRLDGNPLAIELAAARTRMLTAAEIDERLDDRFRLLTGGPRAAPARHRALRAVVDWSYRMLTEREKRMLRGLSVFAGGWTLEAAAAVCGPGGSGPAAPDLDELEALDVLTRLADQSLVEVEPGVVSRYRMLETLRGYAAARLEEAGEEATLWARHLEHFHSLVREAEPGLTGVGQGAWLTRLEREHANVLAAIERCTDDTAVPRALRLCGAMRWFWRLHGHFKTGRDVCARALARDHAAAPTDARAAALHTAAVMATMLGDYEEAATLGEEALVIHRRHDDQRGMAALLNALGNVAYYRGDLDEAARRHVESLRLKRGLGDEPGLASSLNNLANIAHDRGRLDEARRLYEEALTINRRTDNRAWEAINLNNLGLVAHHAGDPEEARLRHRQSLAIRRDLGDRHGVAESLGQLGHLARAAGDFAESRRLHGESLSTRRSLGDRLGSTESLDESAMLAALLGEHELAARFAGAAARARAEIGAPRPPPEQRVFDGCLEASRAALGEIVFDEVRRAGGACSLDEALTDALAWLEAPTARVSA